MLLECEQCHSRFNLDDSLLPKEGTRVRCSICQHTFTAYPSESAPLDEPTFQEEAEDELEETVALDSTPTEEGPEATPGDVVKEEGFEKAFENIGEVMEYAEKMDESILPWKEATRLIGMSKGD